MAKVIGRYEKWIGVVVLFGWIGALAADIFITGYKMPWEVHALCGAVVGGLFSSNPLKGLRGGTNGSS